MFSAFISYEESYQPQIIYNNEKPTPPIQENANSHPINGDNNNVPNTVSLQSGELNSNIQIQGLINELPPNPSRPNNNIPIIIEQPSPNVNPETNNQEGISFNK